MVHRVCWSFNEVCRQQMMEMDGASILDFIATTEKDRHRYESLNIELLIKNSDLFVEQWRGTSHPVKRVRRRFVNKCGLP